MYEDRLSEYLDTQDDAADFWTITDPASDEHAPGFDEWLALRLSNGQKLGDFAEYLADIHGSDDKRNGES